MPRDRPPRLRIIRAILVLLLLSPCIGRPATPAGASPVTYSDYGRAALSTLEGAWFERGRWRMCSRPACPKLNQDWGADALTYDLALRWRITHDPVLTGYFRALLATAPRYGAPCSGWFCDRWSDVPAWDALAAVREGEATGDPSAMRNAEGAFRAVDRATVYARGACPEILYQQPFGRQNQLKTLETDSNLIRAGVELFRATHDRTYLTGAETRYASVRRHFLDRTLSLYTVYVFDDGAQCAALPHRFFASVNGNMIVAGLELSAATKDQRYRQQAIATALAVDKSLRDDAGIFIDMQAENDIVEPLVEGMYDLASDGHLPFAAAWVLRNAQAAVSARTDDGNFARIFDGPPPAGAATAWQTNGGFALMFAAAALAPHGVPMAGRWRRATTIARDISLLPATIVFTGSSIALFGTIGEHCCEPGHASVFIDGEETLDRSGIWQNKSSSGFALLNSVLFAWRWPHSGLHRIRLEPGMPNAKEGASYLHVQRFAILR